MFVRSAGRVSLSHTPDDQLWKGDGIYAASPAVEKSAQFRKQTMISRNRMRDAMQTGRLPGAICARKTQSQTSYIRFVCVYESYIRCFAWFHQIFLSRF